MSATAENPSVTGAGRLDREAFGAFYTQTAPALRSYIRRVAANAAAVDDILQDAYIRLLNAPPLEEQRRRAYLYRVATNLIVDYWRSRERERSWLSRWAWRREPAAGNSELRPDVERLFAKLSVRERALLWLAYVEGADHREIAQVLQLSEKSMRVLLFRARRKMEKILRKHGYNSEVRP